MSKQIYVNGRLIVHALNPALSEWIGGDTASISDDLIEALPDAIKRVDDVLTIGDLRMKIVVHYDNGVNIIRQLTGDRQYTTRDESAT